MDWCNMVARQYITKHGICMIAANYGYPDGAELFRSNIAAQSDNTTIYNTYPAADLLKKYAVTVFFHSGFRKFKSTQLSPGLKGGRLDVKGDFKIVDRRTLVGDGRQHCRLLSLSRSEEFFEWLATKNKNHRYTVYHSLVLINGGRKADSVSSYDAPQLSIEASSSLLKSNNNQIMLHSGTRLGYGKEIEEQNS